MSETMNESSGADVREWNNPRRRMAGLIALAVAVVVLVADLVVYFVSGNKAWLDWTLVGVLVLVLLFLVVLLVAKPRAVTQEAHLGPGAPATLSEATEPPAAPAAPSGLPAITLRCGDCGTVFDVTDTGERPLYHTCPGCGAEGVLKEPAPTTAAATPAAPEPERSPYAPPPPTQSAAPLSSPPPAAPAPAAVRKLKLRCGNCKQVFSIEDTGERPLRRPCPYCARMGEIR